MKFKCPYCLHSFEQEQAEVKVKNETNFYYCPNPKKEHERKICNKRLPLNFFNSESTTISLVGSHFVGKTYFFLALLYQLLNNNPLSRLGIQGDILGGEKENPEVYKILNNMKMGKNIEFTTHDNAIKTVIDIKIIKRNKRKQIYLSFFDNPGESFSDYEDMIENTFNVFQADGIIFLVEPKQLKNFSQKIIEKYSYERNSKPTELYRVVNNLVQLLQHIQNNENVISKYSNRYLRAFFKGLNTKIRKKNIAFTISKFDQISNFYPIEIPYDERQIDELIMRGKLNVNHLNYISEDILDMIDEGDERIKKLINTANFDAAFFGAKAANVNENGTVIDMNDSQGILLPLIWLLKQQNFIS